MPVTNKSYDDAFELLKAHDLELNYPLCVDIAESLDKADRQGRLEEIYTIGNRFVPYGRSDGTPLGDHLEERVATLIEQGATNE